ncbi:hypothetical protein P1X14_11665 [Sphingomonas sp. AOB5]|uniref:hypothetical protein n=1 Tax=Sphingomonas sp. AOB5 TaxID=3034017 RepID=UPI0023F99382|nr:hypothetical protein [Sphingomonas sp. AOB5]MDF7775906.1 hypothetical protein [Sphingomonas sp. AOB5]
MVQGFGAIAWLAASVSVAVGGYMTTTYGAAERARLHTVEGQIIDAKKDIRGLETEFSARANLAQLQQWNGEVVAYAAPVADQFLPDEHALASLDADQDEAMPQVAALVVPAATPKVQAAPAVATAVAKVDKSARAPGKAVASNGSGVTRVASNTRVAMLSASTISDLDRGAASEKLALR